jgi:hypothetical protein
MIELATVELVLAVFLVMNGRSRWRHPANWHRRGVWKRVPRLAEIHRQSMALPFYAWPGGSTERRAAASQFAIGFVFVVTSGMILFAAWRG